MEDFEIEIDVGDEPLLSEVHDRLEELEAELESIPVKILAIVMIARAMQILEQDGPTFH